MSKDSSKQLDDDVGIVPESVHKIPWGIKPSIFVSLAAFLLPQFVIGFAIAWYAATIDKTPLEFFDENENNFLLNFGITVFIASVGSAIIYWYVQSKNGLSKLGFKKPEKNDLFLVMPAYVVYFILLVISNIAIAAVSPDVLNEEQAVGFDGASGGALVLAFVTLVILAPLYEELIFRGFAFRGVASKLGFWPAAIFTSAVFGLAHQQLNVGVDTFLLGMAASWLVWNTKSLWPAILLHVIKNFVAYIFIFVIGTS